MDDLSVTLNNAKVGCHINNNNNIIIKLYFQATAHR